MKLRRWAITMLFTAPICVPSLFNSAWAECPDTGSSFTKKLYAIEDYRKNFQSPAGADCAIALANGINLGAEKWDDNFLNFFRSASDVQRAAAEKRIAEKNMDAADKYLEREIFLRKKLIDEALIRSDDPNENKRLRPYIAQNLSYLVDAWALRSKYLEVANELGSSKARYVNEGAIKLWLQALWSCAKWDGKSQKPCDIASQDICKGKISVFLEFLNQLKKQNLNREFPADALESIRIFRNLQNKKCPK